MKPIIPLQGFNVRRVLTSAGIPFCCVCESTNAQRSKSGTWYCRPCAEQCRAFVDGLRANDDERAALGMAW